MLTNHGGKGEAGVIGKAFHAMCEIRHPCGLPYRYGSLPAGDEPCPTGSEAALREGGGAVSGKSLALVI